MDYLFEERKRLWSLLNCLNKETLKAKEKLRNLEEEIKSMCNHNLVVDTSYQEEHTQYICTKCGFNI